MEANKLCCMDNLELMKDMADESVDLIYGDILYGTDKDFGDYQDLPADRDEIEDFYRPRIKEMHRILKNTGSIYLHMDYRINHWIRCILDDVFGYENFRNEIIWCYKSGGSSKTNFSNKHDNMLFYSKSNNYKFNVQKEKSYNRGYKRYNFDGVKEYKDNKGWYTRVNMKDYWEINMVGRTSKERVDYKTQKPKKLLKRIIKASSNKGDIVFDPFLGSGTTVVVAEELDRKWIGCDINEKSIEVTKDRLSSVQKRLF